MTSHDWCKLLHRFRITCTYKKAAGMAAFLYTVPMDIWKLFRTVCTPSNSFPGGWGQTTSIILINNQGVGGQSHPRWLSAYSHSHPLSFSLSQLTYISCNVVIQGVSTCAEIKPFDHRCSKVGAGKLTQRFASMHPHSIQYTHTSKHEIFRQMFYFLVRNETCFCWKLLLQFRPIYQI